MNEIKRGYELLKNEKKNNLHISIHLSIIHNTKRQLINRFTTTNHVMTFIPTKSGKRSETVAHVQYYGQALII